MARKSKGTLIQATPRLPVAGLCTFNYDMQIMVTQEEARELAAEQIPDSVVTKLKQSIDDDVLMRSEVFQAWYRDPPAPSSVDKGLTSVTYRAADKDWNVTPERFDAIITLCAKIEAAKLGRS